MRIALPVAVLLCVGCSSLPMVDDASLNQESRINHLVIHFTSEDFAESRRLLTGQADASVSVHYLVPEPGDPSYPHNRLRVYRLVPEQRRAWHAGQSYWAGTTALNDSSIGIEIVNRSTCIQTDPEGAPPEPENQSCTLYDFPDEQIELVIRLAADILARNPDIAPVDIVGHGDIAVDRRIDPGPRFPWKRLHENGIGAWFDDETVARYTTLVEQRPPNLGDVQHALSAYGYRIDQTGINDAQTRFAVRAFQMHFRPSDYSGLIDNETIAILFALLEKYRNGWDQRAP